MKKVKLPVLAVVFTILPCSTLFSQENEQLIKDYISQNKIREYKKSDLANFTIENVDDSKSLQGNVVKFRQIYNGYPVYNSVGTALIKDHKIVYYTDNFVKNYTQSAPGSAGINKNTALQKIADNLGDSDISNFSILGFFDKDSNTAQFAKQRLVYTDDKNGNLRLAYEYILKEPKSPNYWNILVDANDGNILMKSNMASSCNIPKGSYSSEAPAVNANGGKNKVMNNEENILQKNSSLLLPDNASYNVFALPLEAPTFGTRTIVSNPWIISASPEGWHSDGTNHYTITRGNNVYAYENTAGANIPGFSPSGGTSRNFNVPFNINGTAAANQNAAITNLFYMNNKIHDIFYKFGFTESARNFQQNNFGNGGLGNDYVKAEAQNNGINGAFFSSTPEGTAPTMDMYLWSTVSRLLYYNAPADAVSRQPVTGKASFGPALTATGITGEVKLSPVLTGCTALPAGSLTGKIGLMENSDNCNSTVKIKNAQNAGAAAVIIYDQRANYPLIEELSGTDPTITIPSISILNSEGVYIKSQLSAGITVNATLKNDPANASVTPDGSFDNGVITHEYGHGISTRLTGDGYSCLDSSLSNEQMGEGWSDFFALMLTNKPGDNASVPRGSGTYIFGQPITGGGIRPAKYSPDFSINNYTYGNTNGMGFDDGSGSFIPDEHAIGFVWATMLWDLNWQYVAKYGYSSDVMASTTNGSSRVLQIVVNALKLQACSPTFIEGRNAILQADLAATGGVDKCMIWRTFAKRGLGVNASAGSKTNINDQVQDFTVPADCVLATDEVKTIKNNISIYPNPAKNEFFINFPAHTLEKISVEVYDMSGKLVSSEDKISPDAKKSISTDKLINGTYMVKVKGLGFEEASKIIVKK